MNESSRSGPAEGRSRLSRRTLFAGAGTAGAVAAVASVMPVVQAPESAAIEAKPAPERGGGYTLSEHVKHYYRTTRL
ncbi:formate dehydrogenase [Hydrogenophaga borbori]|uniref:formate dehydrogenase n=1 Tax=Hydrogenophaga borbori TaxID=2294117 RepID=UPI00301E269C